MRILLLNPNQIGRYNWGHQLFRNEIGKQHQVVYYGPGFPHFNSKWSVKDIIKKKYGNSNPDLIMTYGWRYSKDFNGMSEIDVPKVHIIVDYARPQGIPKQDKFHRDNGYNLLFAITQRAHDLLVKNTPEIPVRIIPFSVDTNIYKPSGVPKEDMVLAAFNARADVYPNRSRIRAALNKMNIKTIQKRVIHRNLINMINKCKISVTSNNIFNSLSMRYTEVLACGGFLLADKPDDLEMVGLEDKKHLVLYNNIKDFKKKVKYYMDPKHDTERQLIEKTGMQFVRKNHSCEIRVKQMTGFIREVIGI
jgi:spore maturation protein CgeB